MKIEKTVHFIFVTKERRHALLTIKAAWQLLIQSLATVSTETNFQIVSLRERWTSFIILYSWFATLPYGLR